MTRNRIVAALSFVALLGLAVMPGIAQAQKANGSSDGSTGDYTLSQGTYNQIQQIQKLIGNDKYDKALGIAKDLLPNAKRESPYAEALTDEMIANIHLVQKQYEDAEPYLKRIVELDALQPSTQLNIVQELAAVYLMKNKFGESIKLYQQVLAQYAKNKKNNVEPDPSLYYRLGLAYSYQADQESGSSQQQDFQNALKYVQEGIDKQQAAHEKDPKKNDPVSKDWYQSLFVINYKMKDYQAARDVAKLLVAKWPNDEDFWTYYANTALLLKDDQQAVAIYGIMYKRGMLKTKDDYMQYASLLLEEKVPYKAGEVLQTGIQKGIIPKTKDNYDELSQAWTAAAEWDKALDALSKAGALAQTGDVYLRESEIYLNRRDYAEAADAAQKALAKGGLKNDEGHALMVLGQAQFEQKNYDAAVSAFKKAEKFKSQEDNARNWLNFVAQTRKNSKGGG